jgi:hypothetical protein
VFTDLGKAAERIPTIKKIEVLTPGPMGVGTRFKETRVVFKREATETMEVTAFEPGRRFVTIASSCGTHYRSEYRFTPEGGGTKVDMSFEARAVSFWAKLMSPLFTLMKGTMRKCFEDDMEALRKVLEDQKQPA